MKRTFCGHHQHVDKFQRKRFYPDLCSFAKRSFEAYVASRAGPRSAGCGVTASFQQSCLTSTVVSDRSGNTSVLVNQQESKIFQTDFVPQKRQSTLQEAFDRQFPITGFASYCAYRSLSETLIRAVCESLGASSEDVAKLIDDSKVTDKVTQAVQSFISENSATQPAGVKYDFDFTGTQLRFSQKSHAFHKVTLDSLTNILPIELHEEAHYKYDEKTEKKKECFKVCLALNKNGTGNRCRNKNNFNELAFVGLMEELHAIPKPRSFSNVAKILLKLVDMLFCSNTTHKKDRRLDILDLCKYFTTSGFSSTGGEVKALENWLDALVQAEQLYQIDLDSKPETQAKTTKVVLPDPSVVLPPAIVTVTKPASSCSNKNAAAITSTSLGPFLFEKCLNFEEMGFLPTELGPVMTLPYKTFRPYAWSKTQRILSEEQLVNQTVKRPLTKDDRKGVGSIYIYRHYGDFGFFKIGYSKDRSFRFKEWWKQCGYQIDEQEDLLKHITREAPHPARLEGLIHAELKSKRFTVQRCKTCHRTHNEWFEVTASEAQHVIIKWTKWMQDQKPYDKQGRFRKEDVDIPPVGNFTTLPLFSGSTQYAAQNNDGHQKPQNGQKQAIPPRSSKLQSGHHMTRRSHICST